MIHTTYKYNKSITTQNTYWWCIMYIYNAIYTDADAKDATESVRSTKPL